MKLIFGNTKNDEFVKSFIHHCKLHCKDMDDYKYEIYNFYHLYKFDKQYLEWFKEMIDDFDESMLSQPVDIQKENR